ncbi:hypothetical protein J6590_066222 [Homalodisca vitripennis]|nr:hypothetical protein J6590_066222 [Homalodisca vitripennis]
MSAWYSPGPQDTLVKPGPVLSSNEPGNAWKYISETQNVNVGNVLVYFNLKKVTVVAVHRVPRCNRKRKPSIVIKLVSRKERNPLLTEFREVRPLAADKKIIA